MRGIDIAASSQARTATFWPGLKTVFQGSLLHPWAASVAVIVGIINGLAMILGAAAVGWSTDHLVIPALSGGSVATATWWISATFILGVSAIRWSTIFIRGVATGIVQHTAQATSRRQLVRQYLRLDVGWHRRHSPGRLMANAVSDVDALWFAMVFAYFALGMVVMLGVALVQLFTRDLGLGLVAAALVGAVLVLNIGYQRALSPRAQQVQRARADVSKVAHESVEGDQVVRTLGLRERELGRFSEATNALRESTTRMGRVSAVFEPLLELVPTAAVLAVLWVGMRQVERGELSYGVVVEVVYLLLTATIPLSVISRFLAMLATSAAGRERVEQVLHNNDVLTTGDRRLESTGPLEIRAEKVSVWLGSAPVLRDVDIRVQPGETVAIVGATGAGKSTLLDVLSGQLEPTTGQVFIGGVSVREIAPDQVHRLLGYVGQNAFLFAGTIRENLELAGHPRERRPYRDQELWTALEAASAATFVRSLPEGLDTVIGARGSTVSGGQRQRLCLARTILRQPAALLLDDATSALDTQVEHDVLAALTQIAHQPGGPTMVIVANRLSSIALADRVVVLQAGRVVADGSHADLLSRNEHYRGIVHAYQTPQDEGPHAIF